MFEIPRLYCLQTLEYNKKKFAAADEDGDGQLTYGEMTVFQHPYDYGRMAAVEIEKALDDFDGNQDGIIERYEYENSETLNERK